MLNIKKVIFLVLSMLVVTWLTSCGEVSTPAIPPAATVPPATTQPDPSNLDLTYPGALKLTEKDIWPTGRSTEMQQVWMSGFIGKDSWQQVYDFYQKKLGSLGYKVEPSYTCLDPGVCQEIYTFDAAFYHCEKDQKGNSQCSDTYQIDFLVANTRATIEERQRMNLPDQLYQLIKPGQTLIMFYGRMLNPVPYVENPTTAARLDPYTPAPKTTP